MFFSVGVETPKDENTAYGMIIPAFSAYDCGCFSAADTQEEIAANVRDAILLTVECIMESGKISVEQITDAGYLTYSANAEYADFDSWFMIDVDLSAFEGKQKRINIALPDRLISRIDHRVKESPALYRDRSHFLALAARHELSAR